MRSGSKAFLGWLQARSLQLKELERRGSGAKIRFAKLAVAAVLAAALAVGIDLGLHAVLGPTSAGAFLNEHWIGFFFCLIFLGLAFVSLRSDLGSKPEVLYLVVVLTITCFFTLSQSVWQQSWDEGIFYRIVSLMAAAPWEGEHAFSYGEACFVGFVDPVTGDNSLAFRERTLDALHQRAAAVDAEGDGGLSMVVGQPWMAYQNIAMIPMALVMMACKMASVPVSVAFVLSKLPCAIIYSTVTYLGMKRLQGGKAFFAAVALIPTSLFLASNYSYAYWTYSLILFGCACLVSIIQSRDMVESKSIVLMLGAFVLAALPRVVYASMLILCLIVPRSRFSSRGRSVAYRAAILVPCVSATLIAIVIAASTGIGGGDSRGGENIQPTEQLGFVLSHPLEYAQMVFGFLFAPFANEGGLPDEEGASLIAGFASPQAWPGYFVNYGYLPRPSWAFTAVVIAVLLFSALTDKDEYDAYGFVPALASWGICLVAMLLIITYMYLVFNDVGSDVIRGVQRRYMLPFIYPMLVFLGCKRWNLCGSAIPKAAYNGGVISIMALVSLGSWWQVYLSALN